LKRSLFFSLETGGECVLPFIHPFHTIFFFLFIFSPSNVNNHTRINHEPLDHAHRRGCLQVRKIRGLGENKHRTKNPQTNKQKNKKKQNQRHSPISPLGYFWESSTITSLTGVDGCRCRILENKKKKKKKRERERETT